jgi:hypothetical protein
MEVAPGHGPRCRAPADHRARGGERARSRSAGRLWPGAHPRGRKPRRSHRCSARAGRGSGGAAGGGGPRQPAGNAHAEVADRRSVDRHRRAHRRAGSSLRRGSRAHRGRGLCGRPLGDRRGRRGHALQLLEWLAGGDGAPSRCGYLCSRVRRSGSHRDEHRDHGARAQGPRQDGQPGVPRRPRRGGARRRPRPAHSHARDRRRVRRGDASRRSVRDARDHHGKSGSFLRGCHPRRLTHRAPPLPRGRQAPHQRRARDDGSRVLLSARVDRRRDRARPDRRERSRRGSSSRTRTPRTSWRAASAPFETS